MKYSLEDKQAFISEMQRRTKAQAIAIINLIEKAPFSTGIKVVGNQIVKSATSTAANYRAACRSRSKAEFFAKMSIVVEESDETVFWLEILKDSDIKCDKSKVESLIPEANKICAVMAKARSNIKR